MDIYEFINSRDIRRHCRKLGHKFNAIESAYIIYHSRKTIAEKHTAYREIIETMPDMEFKRDDFMTADYDSFHEFLRRYIDFENKLIEIFKAEDRAVYRWSVKSPDFLERSYDMFEDWKSCQESCAENWAYDNISEYMVGKYRIKKSKNDKEECEIEAHFNLDNKIIYIYGDITDYDGIQNIFDTIWIEVPTPFEKGDILYDPNGIKGNIFYPNSPFVLTNLCTWDSEKQLERKRKEYDSLDMTASGYFYDDNAINIYGECMHSYIDLEYYTSELKGKERVLKAVSSFLKEDIDLSLLLNAFMIITQNEDAKRRISHLGWTSEALQFAGLKEDSTNSVS